MSKILEIGDLYQVSLSWIQDMLLCDENEKNKENNSPHGEDESEDL